MKLNKPELTVTRFGSEDVIATSGERTPYFGIRLNTPNHFTDNTFFFKRKPDGKEFTWKHGEGQIDLNHFVDEYLHYTVSPEAESSYNDTYFHGKNGSSASLHEMDYLQGEGQNDLFDGIYDWKDGGFYIRTR